jgi:uncharacterized protein (DUF1778 family)
MRRDETPGPARQTYAMRLAEDERRVVAAAAAQRGEPLSAYIRRVALETARRELAAI